MSMGPGSKFFGAPPNEFDDPMNGGLAHRSNYEPPHMLEPHRSPSPGSSRIGPYSRYGPPRPPPGYARDGYDSSFGSSSESWVQERSFRQRTPSGPYTPHSQNWSRPPNAWSTPFSAGSWPERRLPPPISPVQRGFGREADSSTESMFEPSEAWKQTHVPGDDRPSPEARQFGNNRMRDSRPPSSPERPFRNFETYAETAFGSSRPYPKDDSRPPQSPERPLRKFETYAETAFAGYNRPYSKDYTEDYADDYPPSYDDRYSRERESYRTSDLYRSNPDSYGPPLVPRARTPNPYMPTGPPRVRTPNPYAAVVPPPATRTPNPYAAAYDEDEPGWIPSSDAPPLWGSYRTSPNAAGDYRRSPVQSASGFHSRPYPHFGQHSRDKSHSSGSPNSVKMSSPPEPSSAAPPPSSGPPQPYSFGPPAPYSSGPSGYRQPPPRDSRPHTRVFSQPSSYVPSHMRGSFLSSSPAARVLSGSSKGLHARIRSESAGRSSIASSRNASPEPHTPSATSVPGLSRAPSVSVETKPSSRNVSPTKVEPPSTQPSSPASSRIGLRIKTDGLTGSTPVSRSNTASTLRPDPVSVSRLDTGIVSRSDTAASQNSKPTVGAPLIPPMGRLTPPLFDSRLSSPVIPGLDGSAKAMAPPARSIIASASGPSSSVFISDSVDQTTRPRKKKKRRGNVIKSKAIVSSSPESTHEPLPADEVESAPAQDIPEAVSPVMAKKTIPLSSTHLAAPAPSHAGSARNTGARPTSPGSSDDHTPSLATPAPPDLPPTGVRVASTHEEQLDHPDRSITSAVPMDIDQEAFNAERSKSSPSIFLNAEPSKSSPSIFPESAKSAQSLQEALRLVVTARQLHSVQTREDIVRPILMANKAKSLMSRPPLNPGAPAPAPAPESETPHAEALVQELMEGEVAEKRISTFESLRLALVTRIGARRESIQEKTERLRKEYLEHHEAWMLHCARLDRQSQAPTTANTNADEVAPAPGRTTRRSAAVLGDAVRSDLEMEQIIASLGNEDLYDPAHLAIKNVAVIPDMISVTNGQVDYQFDDTNKLVDDPASYYDPSRDVSTWTDEETQVFLEKFAAHPKQFGIIANFLPHKTQAQCVQFYYLHKKKLINFRKVVMQYGPRKRRGGRNANKKKGNALLTDIRRHDAEVSSKDKEPSAAAAGKASGSGTAPTGRKKRGAGGGQSVPIPVETAQKRKPSGRKTAVQVQQAEPTPTTTPTPDPDPAPTPNPDAEAPPARPKRKRAAPVSKVKIAADDADSVATPTDAEPKPVRRRRVAKAVVIEEPEGEGSDSEKRPVKKRRGPGGRKPKTLPAIVESSVDPSASTTEIPYDGPTDAAGPSRQKSVSTNGRAESQTEEEMDAAAVIQALDPLDAER